MCKINYIYINNLLGQLGLGDVIFLLNQLVDYKIKNYKDSKVVFFMFVCPFNNKTEWKKCLQLDCRTNFTYCKNNDKFLNVFLNLDKSYNIDFCLIDIFYNEYIYIHDNTHEKINLLVNKFTEKSKIISFLKDKLKEKLPIDFSDYNTKLELKIENNPFNIIQLKNKYSLDITGLRNPVWGNDKNKQYVFPKTIERLKLFNKYNSENKKPSFILTSKVYSNVGHNIINFSLNFIDQGKYLDFLTALIFRYLIDGLVIKNQDKIKNKFVLIEKDANLNLQNIFQIIKNSKYVVGSEGGLMSYTLHANIPYVVVIPDFYIKDINAGNFHILHYIFTYIFNRAITKNVYFCSSLDINEHYDKWYTLIERHFANEITYKIISFDESLHYFYNDIFLKNRFENIIN
jgi:hypothetical protein